MYNIRTAFLKFLKKHFIENMDYMFVLTAVMTNSGSGSHNKMTLKIRCYPFKCFDES